MVFDDDDDDDVDNRHGKTWFQSFPTCGAQTQPHPKRFAWHFENRPKLP